MQDSLRKYNDTGGFQSSIDEPLELCREAHSLLATGIFAVPQAMETIQEEFRTGQAWNALAQGACFGIGLSWMINQNRPTPVRLIGAAINTGMGLMFTWDTGQTIGKVWQLKDTNKLEAQKIAGRFIADGAIGVLSAPLGFAGEHVANKLISRTGPKQLHLQAAGTNIQYRPNSPSFNRPDRTEAIHVVFNMGHAHGSNNENLPATPWRKKLQWIKTQLENPSQVKHANEKQTSIAEDKLVSATPDELHNSAPSIWKDDVLNPYLEKFAKLRNQEDRFDELRSRRNLVMEYAWAIPSKEALSAIFEHSKEGGLVEIGPGNGYWSHLLRQHGLQLHAYDKHPVETKKNHYFERCSKSWTAIIPGTEQSVTLHPGATLLQCWPDYDTDFAARTLINYEGKKVCYVGEGYGGCTGDNIYHEILDNHWKPIEEIAIPQWFGINDRLTIYERNSAAYDGPLLKHPRKTPAQIHDGLSYLLFNDHALAPGSGVSIGFQPKTLPKSIRDYVDHHIDLPGSSFDGAVIYRDEFGKSYLYCTSGDKVWADSTNLPAFAHTPLAGNATVQIGSTFKLQLQEKTGGDFPHRSLQVIDGIDRSTPYKPGDIVFNQNAIACKIAAILPENSRPILKSLLHDYNRQLSANEREKPAELLHFLHTNANLSEYQNGKPIEIANFADISKFREKGKYDNDSVWRKTMVDLRDGDIYELMHCRWKNRFNWQHVDDFLMISPDELIRARGHAAQVLPLPKEN